MSGISSLLKSNKKFQVIFDLACPKSYLGMNASPTLLLTTAGIHAHLIPENKRKAQEALTAVFAGGSEKVADGQREERTGVVTPVSEN